jgi:two-component system OmpR family response regulator
VSERRRVLVVDDQEDIREMARLVLTGAGYEVATASSGREALRKAREAPFDLMLLDINMPDLDGWATLRLLRADEAHDDLKVAMFSVKSEVRDKVAGLKDGAIDYLTKPFSVDELVTRVSRILAEANGASAVPSASPR